MERWKAKVIALFATFAVIFICMSLPVKVAGLIQGRGSRRAGIVLSLLRCFGGGVFLGTILLHMVPEVRDMVHGAVVVPYDLHYPLPETCILAGFFFICFFEKVVMSAHRRGKERRRRRAAGEDDLVPAVLLTAHFPKAAPGGGGGGGGGGGTPAVLSEVIKDVEKDFLQDDKEQDQVVKTANNISVITVEVSEPEKKSTANGIERKPQKTETKETDDANKDDGVPQTRSIILLLALSFECIFDGLGVGLQPTTAGVWNIFIAVISHESIVSFCLGLELFKFHPPRKVLLAAFLYALIPPAGNLTGIIITETRGIAAEGTVTMVNGVLLGVACGIFLYCTFIGMLGEELIGQATWGKIAAMLLGCAIMAGLATVPEGDGGETPPADHVDYQR